MMDKKHTIEQLLSFYMGKKYARPSRIYHQEFEGGVGRDDAQSKNIKLRLIYSINFVGFVNGILFCYPQLK
jgi:hypothetical protein